MLEFHPRKAARALIFTLFLSLFHVACGGGGTSVTLNGLNQLPSASNVVASSSTSAIRNAYGLRALSLQNAVGTPPLLTSFESVSQVDAKFFDGAVAAINSPSFSSLSQAGKEALRDKFYGQVEGGPGGQGACMMAQSVGEAIGRMLESDITVCYLKNMPSAEGVQISPSLEDPSTLFAQQAEDRIVKVNISGYEGEGGGSGEDHMPDAVFIQVSGTASVTEDVYRVHLYFCQDGSVTGSETIEVNKANGLYTTESYENDEGGSGGSRMTGYVINNGSVLTFDPSRPREVSGGWRWSYQGEKGVFKGNLVINPDSTIDALRYDEWSGQGHSGVDRNYSKSAYSGTGLSTLRFLHAAYKGLNNQSGEDETWSYAGDANWNENVGYYQSGSNDFSASVNAYDFSAGFWDGNIQEGEMEGDCSASPDYTVEMNFSLPSAQEVSQTCETDRFENYNMCWGSEIQQAQQALWF